MSEVSDGGEGLSGSSSMGGRMSGNVEDSGMAQSSMRGDYQGDQATRNYSGDEQYIDMDSKVEDIDQTAAQEENTVEKISQGSSLENVKDVQKSQLVQDTMQGMENTSAREQSEYEQNDESGADQNALKEASNLADLSGEIPTTDELEDNRMEEIRPEGDMGQVINSRKRKDHMDYVQEAELEMYEPDPAEDPVYAKIVEKEEAMGQQLVDQQMEFTDRDIVEDEYDGSEISEGDDLQPSNEDVQNSLAIQDAMQGNNPSELKQHSEYVQGAELEMYEPDPANAPFYAEVVEKEEAMEQLVDDQTIESGKIEENSDWVDHGIVDVPVDELPDSEYVSSPDDFDHNISWEVAKNATEQLPELQKQVNEGKTGDDFSAQDEAEGKSYQNGRRRLYDLYYGSDPIRVGKVGDKYIIDKGNHRIYAAKHLGLKTLPMRVMEKQT